MAMQDKSGGSLTATDRVVWNDQLGEDWSMCPWKLPSCQPDRQGSREEHATRVSFLIFVKKFGVDVIAGRFKLDLVPDPCFFLSTILKPFEKDPPASLLIQHGAC